ncbi:MAG TPA: hypothetical protein VM554_14980 [Acidisarcina sp.]|nr:hypothetical protein [Acidisarcina sp.]
MRKRAREEADTPTRRWGCCAQREIDGDEIADRSAAEEFPSLAKKSRADALRTNLNDAPGAMRGSNHGCSIGNAMRHRLFAVDILAGLDCVHHECLMPVIWNRNDQAFDVLVVQQFVILACGSDLGAGNLAGKGMALIIKVAGGNASRTRQCNRVCEEPGPLHADADDRKANRIFAAFTLVDWRLCRERDCMCADGGCGCGGNGGGPEKLAAGEFWLHRRLHATGGTTRLLPRAMAIGSTRELQSLWILCRSLYC